MANGEYQQMIELTTADGKRYYYDTPEKEKYLVHQRMNKNLKMNHYLKKT